MPPCRQITVAILGLTLAFAAAPAVAHVADNERVVRITARVQPFCRITHQLGDGAAALIDGQADLGQVRELCNVARGYQVRAQFLNLTSGSLMTGDEAFPVAADGLVEFGSPTARSRVRNWRVVNAAQDAPSQIYLRVSISPL